MGRLLSIIWEVNSGRQSNIGFSYNPSQNSAMQSTQVRFASFLSGGFITVICSSKSTGKETGETHLCAVLESCWKDYSNLEFFAPHKDNFNGRKIFTRLCSKSKLYILLCSVHSWFGNNFDPCMNLGDCFYPNNLSLKSDSIYCKVSHKQP